jgi:hypothetical protein
VLQDRKDCDREQPRTRSRRAGGGRDQYIVRPVATLCRPWIQRRVLRSGGCRPWEFQSMLG